MVWTPDFDEPNCSACGDYGFVTYGDDDFPCPQCRTEEYDEAIGASAASREQGEI